MSERSSSEPSGPNGRSHPPKRLPTPVPAPFVSPPSRAPAPNLSPFTDPGPEHDHPFARPDPDLDIVRLAQARATRRMAMGILYERFRGRVYNTALRIVGDRDEAADVLQEVFILLFRKIHRFKARAQFASWVYRISVNVSLDQLRRRKRAPAAGATMALLDGAPDRTPLSTPESHTAQRDLEGHVQDALQALSERLRIVIILRYLEGLAYADIAEILDCSLGTVKSRLNRAHAAMRQELSARYEHDLSEGTGA